MNIQEKVNRLGSSYVQKIQKPSVEEEETTKVYSCLTEEDYDKAKNSLTEEEKRVVAELHEQFKDYMQIYSIWNIARKFSFDLKISRCHIDVQYKRFLENQENEWKSQAIRQQNGTKNTESHVKGVREHRKTNERVHSNLRPKKTEERQERKNYRNNYHNGQDQTEDVQAEGVDATQRREKRRLRQQQKQQEQQDGQQQQQQHQHQQGEHQTEENRKNSHHRREQVQSNKRQSQQRQVRQHSKGEPVVDSHKNSRQNKREQEYVYVRKADLKQSEEVEQSKQESGNVVEVVKTEATVQQTTENGVHSNHGQQVNTQSKHNHNHIHNHKNTQNPTNNGQNNNNHNHNHRHANGKVQTQQTEFVKKETIIPVVVEERKVDQVKATVPPTQNVTIPIVSSVTQAKKVSTTEIVNKDLAICPPAKTVPAVVQSQPTPQPQPIVKQNTSSAVQANKATIAPVIHNAQNNNNTVTSTATNHATKTTTSQETTKPINQQQKTTTTTQEAPKIAMTQQYQDHSNSTNNQKKVTQIEKTQDNLKTTHQNEKSVTPRASQVSQRTEPTTQAQKVPSLNQNVDVQQRDEARTEQALQQPQKFQPQVQPTYTTEQFNQQQQTQWQYPPFFPHSQMMPMIQPSQLPQMPQAPGYYICYIPYPPQQPTSSNGTVDATIPQQPLMPQMMPMQYPMMPMPNQQQGTPFFYPPYFQPAGSDNKPAENGAAAQQVPPMMPMYAMPMYYPQVPIQNNSVNTSSN